MCGRFSETHSEDSIKKRFNVDVDFEWKPRYNAAPSDQLPVILDANTHAAVLSTWGIEPAWMKSRKGRRPLINARAETLLAKATFRDSFLHRRCLVLADGFYEWQRNGSKKIPFRVALRSGGLFAFAGLWQTLKSARGVVNTAFVIITTEPNGLLAPIHNRMPAILRPEHESRWLSNKESENNLMFMLKPYAAGKMHAFRVSTLVNSPANDVPAVMRPDAD